MSEIPFVSDKLMEQIDKIFYHGEQRAKSHDLRFGQWLVNKIRTENWTKKNITMNDDQIIHILFNMENPEFLELVKDYND